MESPPAKALKWRDLLSQTKIPHFNHT